MRKVFKNVTPKRQQGWLDKHYASRLEGEVYSPLWKVHDIRSSGVKCKIKHFAHDRVVHLLSQNEVCQFLLLAFNVSIIDAHEQYALPLNETLDIAKRLNIKHPKYPGTKVPIAQTLDFYCETKIGFNGIAVKQQDELFKVRSLEKLAIQEAYCAKHELPFDLVSSDDLKIEPVRNLERLYRHSNMNSFLVSMNNAWLKVFLEIANSNKYSRTSCVLMDSANKTGIAYDVVAHFFYNNIWHKKIDIDWYQPLFLERTIEELGINMFNQSSTTFLAKVA